MEYRQLGRSGLRVSTLTLGTMTFGGRGKFSQVGETDTKRAQQQIDMCLEAGMNFFDTADIYSHGLAEEILGKTLKKCRDDVLIASKARFALSDGANEGGSSRYHLIRACEDSLRRLDTDRIDLYQLHQWDGQTPLEETLEALDTLVRSGKVRYVGFSNFSGWHAMKALATADRYGFVRPVSQQIHYTLQAREAEYELLPLSLDQGVGNLIWSPLAGGLLSGKYRRGKQPPEGSRHLTEWNEPPVYDEEKLYDIVEELVAVADAHNVSAAQISLAWLLGRPGVSSIVIGARTDEQLKDNLHATEIELSEDERKRLDKVSRVPLPYPYWHQMMTAPDRLSAADLSLLREHLENQ